MKKKILVVDDNTVNVELLTERLTLEGYEVDSAPDGVEGLKKILLNKPDLILLDIMMPRMDGYELCRMLKANEETRCTPVVIISAKGELDERVAGIEIGAEDYITKPFNLVELSARVNSIIKMRDLTARLAESEKMAALGEVVLAVAHELRNPLTTIGGLAGRIAEKARGGEMESHAVSIVNGVKRLERLVDRVEEYQEVLTSNLVAGDVREVVFKAVDEAIDEAKSEAGGRVVLIEAVHGDGLPEVKLDEGNLKAAVLNILQNSIEASPEGGVVTVEVRRAAIEGGGEGEDDEDDDAGAVELLVRDKGWGMDEDQLKDVLLPLSTSKMEGAGLGMAIADRVVRDHGGELTIESKPGEGTTVIMTLPAAPAASAAVALK